MGPVLLVELKMWLANYTWHYRPSFGYCCREAARISSGGQGFQLALVLLLPSILPVIGIIYDAVRAVLGRCPLLDVEDQHLAGYQCFMWYCLALVKIRILLLFIDRTLIEAGHMGCYLRSNRYL